MHAPSISLITVTYNSAAALKHFWGDWPSDIGEWIVVDNASTDGSASVARALGARVVQLDHNVGFSAANNIGAQEATGDIIGFLNPDVSPTREGVDALSARLRAGEMLVAPQLINVDGTSQENGRNAPYPLRKLAHMFAPNSRVNQRYVRHVDGGLQRVIWVMGAAVFMNMDTFDRIGGWDAGYFIYYEDSDICLRALEKNIPTFVDGDVRWVHGWARETRTTASFSIWKHEIRSAARFYRLHPNCILPIGPRSGNIRGVEALHGHDNSLSPLRR